MYIQLNFFVEKRATSMFINGISIHHYFDIYFKKELGLLKDDGKSIL